MSNALLRLLFPTHPRDLPGRRGLKLALRGLHVLCAGVFVGSQVFASTPDERTAWGVAAALTGGMMLAVDLHESAAFLLQVRGVVLLTKLACLCALPWMATARVPVLMVLVVVAVASSHAPAKVRYRLLLGRGRIAASESRG